MGILFWNKEKKADPAKRQPGYGVVHIKPFLFVKPDDFFKELRRTILPYLSDEEEEAILNFFDGEPKKEFRALVDKDIFNSIAGNKYQDSNFFSLTVRANSWRGHNVSNHCCSDWSAFGCCTGIVMPQHLQALDRQDRLEEGGELLKDYCIISNINYQLARDQKEDLVRVDSEAIFEED